jgi:hypothetical protein
MNAKRWIMIGAMASAAVALTAWAIGVPATRTFRTTASVRAVFQVPNPLATNTALLAKDTFTGHDLVALALGTPLTTVLSNQVLALEIDCGTTEASLVVFDTVLSSNIVTIAASTHVDALTSQDDPGAVGPNRERFVIQMGVNTNGFLVGGFLTVAGRAYLNPTNGCPRTVLVDIDKKDDKIYADLAVKDTDEDAKVKDKAIAGQAHLIGVVNALFLEGGSIVTNTTLLPFGQMTVKRQLLP